MKKITICVDDKVDLAELGLHHIMAVAKEFKVESLNGDASTSKIIRKVVPGATTNSTVMSHFTPEGMFKKNNVETWFRQVGYSMNSVESTLHRLVKDGYLRSLGGGKWQFVKPMPKQE